MTEPNQDEIQRVLSGLSDTEIKQIKKENPFRRERNAMIRSIIKRGVKVGIVAEITGFSRSTISRIALDQYKRF